MSDNPALDAIAAELNELGYHFKLDTNIPNNIPFYRHKLGEGRMIVLIWFGGKIRVMRRTRLGGNNTTFREKRFDLTYPGSIEQIIKAVQDFTD